MISRKQQLHGSVPGAHTVLGSVTGVFHLLLPRAALANLSALEGGGGNEGVEMNVAWQLLSHQDTVGFRFFPNSQC